MALPWGSIPGSPASEGKARPRPCGCPGEVAGWRYSTLHQLLQGSQQRPARGGQGGNDLVSL